MILRLYACICLVCLFAAVAHANHATARWEGLTGLFTMPTAEIMPHGNAALTYSELRFRQENTATKLLNTWFSTSATFSVTSRLEIAVTDRHELVDFGPVTVANYPSRSDEVHWQGHAKYVLIPVKPKTVGMAVGVMDISDTTDIDTGVIREPGRHLFLVGTYDWATLGILDDEDNLELFAGARWMATENIDLVAEWSSIPLFSHVIPEPATRTNFNIGARIYPRSVPQMRVDAAAIGDGQFDFGFSLSYNF